MEKFTTPTSSSALSGADRVVDTTALATKPDLASPGGDVARWFAAMPPTVTMRAPSWRRERQVVPTCQSRKADSCSSSPETSRHLLRCHGNRVATQSNGSASHEQLPPRQVPRLASPHKQDPPDLLHVERCHEGQHRDSLHCCCSEAPPQLKRPTDDTHHLTPNYDRTTRFNISSRQQSVNCA